MDVVKICQALKHRQGNFSNDIDIDSTNSLVNAIQRPFVHEFHANAYVRVGQEGPPERNYVFRVAVMHDLELTQDLLSYRWLCIDENNL